MVQVAPHRLWLGYRSEGPSRACALLVVMKTPGDSDDSCPCKTLPDTRLHNLPKWIYHGLELSKSCSPATSQTTADYMSGLVNVTTPPHPRVPKPASSINSIPSTPPSTRRHAGSSGARSPPCTAARKLRAILGDDFGRFAAVPTVRRDTSLRGFNLSVLAPIRTCVRKSLLW